jgi:hypothetical protein
MNLESGALVQVLPPPPSLWSLHIEESGVMLRPTLRTIKRRLEGSLANPAVSESVKMSLSNGNISDLLEAIALPGLRELMSQEGRSSPRGLAFLETMEGRVEGSLIELDARDLTWVDLESLSRRLGKQSVLPWFNRRYWKEALETEDGREGLKVFFGTHWDRVSMFMDRHLIGGNRWDDAFEPSPLAERYASDKDWVSMFELLPEHMQGMYGRYSSFRGRNCFATALQFQTPSVLADRSVNMVREREHHSSMINSDEFSSALWRGYSQLTEGQVDEGVRFGDLVVFYDESRGEGYRSMLHAAVHVGGRYYFHKPSKSAASPVEFARWDEMVRTWRRHSSRLGYQVYRKNPISSDNYPDIRSAHEKINWTP